MHHNAVILKQGREKSVLNGHPWIFSGAIKVVTENLKNGEVVGIYDHAKKFIGRGFYNSRSSIAVRVLTRIEEEIGSDFFNDKINRAIFLRKNILKIDLFSNAYRVVNSEGDGFPGLVVDKYGDHHTVKFQSLGMKKQEKLILEILVSALKPGSIFQRMDRNIALSEGIEFEEGELYGNTPEMVEIFEWETKYMVDLRVGQKTGFYLDQKFARKKVSEMAKDKRVLDIFSYSGGFGIAAMKGGAEEVCFVDKSKNSLEMARVNSELNVIPGKKIEYRAGDAFEVLRKLRDQGMKFDLIVVDPPSFTKSKRDVQDASKGYKDLNLIAMNLFEENGLLATFSCSHHIDEKLFSQIVWGASVDSGRNFQVIEKLGQAPDHPVFTGHPEGRYLKGLILRAM